MPVFSGAVLAPCMNRLCKGEKFFHAMLLEQRQALFRERQGSFLIAARCLQIGHRRQQVTGIVLVEGKPAVALRAQEAAHLAAGVAMVDGETFVRDPAADRAGAVLTPSMMS
jgi:hypothetical protein